MDWGQRRVVLIPWGQTASILIIYLGAICLIVELFINLFAVMPSQSNALSSMDFDCFCGCEILKKLQQKLKFIDVCFAILAWEESFERKNHNLTWKLRSLLFLIEIKNFKSFSVTIKELFAKQKYITVKELATFFQYDLLMNFVFCLVLWQISNSCI